MDNLLYKAATFSLIVTCWHVGVAAASCDLKFNKSKCTYEVLCNEYYDFAFSNYQSRGIKCSNDIAYPNGILSQQDYHPVNLQIKKVVRADIGIKNTYGSHIVTTLDLSGSNFNFYPALSSMENLNKLNMSRNSLTVAKLSHKYQMQSLSEIDYSYNFIKMIELNSDERPYNKLRKLIIANNELESIPESIFHSLPEVEYLDLSFNYIDDLSILTFEGLKNIMYLYLSHNKIKDINSSLLRFNKLVTLDLSNNIIKHINTNDFRILLNLETIDFSHNSLLSVEGNLFDKLNSLKTLHLNNNALETLDKDTFLNSSHLVNISLSKNNIKLLPKDMFKGMNITTFSIEGNNLQGSIVNGTFNGLSLVTYLDLSYQNFTSIEDYAFFGLEKLKTLLLNNNNIQFVSMNSFKTLFDINQLDLSYNQISNLDFDKIDLRNLRSLLVKGNYITKIKPEYFSALDKLEFLDMSNNNISLIEPNSFTALQSLINFQFSPNLLNGILEENTFNGLTLIPNVDISGTMLTLISNSSFGGMTHLKQLNMSHSKISVLQYNSFSNTGAIEILDLSFNELMYFTVNTSYLIKVNTLKLNNNALKTLSMSFKGMTKLTKIILSYNNIEMISNDLVDQKDLIYLDVSYNSAIKLNVSQIEYFQGLKILLLSGVQTNVTFSNVRNNIIPLSDLDMSNSGLSNISALELKQLKNLANLALNNNDIVRVEVGAFSNLSHLSVLDLSNNKITYIQPGTFKDNPMLFMLNISHNSLTNIGYGIFRGLNQLQTLDMSFNQIDNLKTERFYEVNSLRVLIADHNKIDSVNIDEFAGTKLSKLSIGDNPLPCDILVKLKNMTIPFVITAIRIDERSDENIDGITCNMEGSRYKTQTISTNVPNNDNKILIEIKDILHNESFEERRSENIFLQYIANITMQNQQSDSELTSTIIIANNSTNVLLNKILRRLTSITDFYTEYVKEKATNESKNLNNDILLATAAPVTRNEKIEPQSFLFIEVCIGLLLFVLVAFLLYVMFYNSVFSIPYGRSFRNLLSTNTMESSSL